MAHLDDLEQLLDSAIDDFQTLNLGSSQRSGGRDALPESRPCLPTGVVGLGTSLPELKVKRKGKHMVSKESRVEEAVDMLRKQTQEAVTQLECVTGSNPDAVLEEWVKQFEELAGSQGMEAVVEMMMQLLLSKESLQQPMKEIEEHYSAWLKENEANLRKEEHERYVRQYELVRNLNEVYEEHPEDYTKVVNLLQKMQECGQPPDDILHGISPDIDLSAFTQT